MSIPARSWVPEHSQAKGTDRLVLLAITFRVSGEDGNSYPSEEEIANMCKISKLSAQRSIQKLEEMGELIVHRNASESGANSYELPEIKASRSTNG